MNWANLLSLRLWLGAFLAGLVAAVPFTLIFPPLGTVVMLVVMGLVARHFLTDPALKAYCPKCRKRAKIGATRCHHCGAEWGAGAKEDE